MYIKLINGQPENYTIGQLRRDNPNTSFPKTISNEILAGFDVYPYTTQTVPAFDEKTQKLDDGEFVQDGEDNWQKVWAILEKTQEEVDEWVSAKSLNIRAERNRLISETDYLALSDTTLTPEMAVYRQSLRDITSQLGFPENIVWPVKP